MKQGKVFEIPKELVWQSWLQVRANKGSAGSDSRTLKEFEENRNRNLYKIWNRLSSGSYFPPPVLEKRIPKGDGRERVLGIPTVADRVAQGTVKIHVETCFTFLGYDFRLRTVKSPHTGKLARKCMPGASKKAMKGITKTIRDWRLHRGKRRTTGQAIQPEDTGMDHLLRRPLVP